MVTTFDETGLFDTPGAEEQPTRPRRGRVTIVFVVAAALVLGGLVWVLLPGGSDEPGADMSVALLERERQPTDELAADVAAEANVDADTSRFAVRTAAGQHYAARRWDGALCLVVVPEGDVSRAVCSAAGKAATVTATAEDGSAVRLVADGAATPSEDDGWRPAGSNVWVLDAPTTE